MKNTPQSLRASETFLKHRQWIVFSAVGLKEAVSIIIKNQPEFVILPVDHPNPKIKILPKLLFEAFAVKIILYSEKTTPSVLQTLREMKQPYVIYPPISGPAIERTLLKIHKDIEITGLDLLLGRKNEFGGRSRAKLNRGEIPSAQESTLTYEQARGALSELMNSPDEGIWDPHVKPLESIVQKGVSSALESAVLPKQTNNKIQKIENTSHLACITINSTRFSGYLVAALGKDRKIDKDFMNLIKSRLFEFLRANGEQVKNEEALSITLQEVKFESWALEQAEFLRKAIHDSDEIAMAFFPSREVEIKLAESASKKMVGLPLSELKEDVPVEFDLYMHLPMNNKYLLYTPQGMPFYRSQKTRLQNKGVSLMHLQKESASDVKKYRVQNFLNEKIMQYKKGSIL